MTEPEAGAVALMLGTCETPVRVVTESGEEVPLPTREQYQGPVYESGSGILSNPFSKLL